MSSGNASATAASNSSTAFPAYQTLCVEDNGAVEQRPSNNSASTAPVSQSASNGTALFHQLQALQAPAAWVQTCFVALLFASTLRAFSLFGCIPWLCQQMWGNAKWPTYALLAVRTLLLLMALAATFGVLFLHIIAELMVHKAVGAETAFVRCTYGPMFQSAALILVLLVLPVLFYAVRWGSEQVRWAKVWWCRRRRGCIR